MPALAGKRTRAAWKMLFPVCIVLLAIAGFPLFKTLWYSFTDARLDDLDAATWLGFENYVTIFNDPLWWHAVAQTLKFTFASVAIELVLGLGIALALSREFPLRGWVRAAVLVPWAIPTVVSSRIWEWMYNDQYGVINQALSSLHLASHPISFLATPELQLASMVAVDVWKTTPFMVLLIMAGLTTIASDVTEAARVDGASSWQIFRQITLPLLKPTLAVAITFRVLDALRVFDVVYVLFGSNESTSTISVFARTQMVDFQEMGLGSAASILIFLLIGAFIVVQTLAMSRQEKES